ncbi:hypothetical protein ACFYRN_19180 [Streptomyces sp. NPDC005227]|uniref:hypothetical protein n=1 Tax=Streptomyces sp. NPDC005227 TaxID=3364707 RepID=UPI0036892E2F
MGYRKTTRLLTVSLAGHEVYGADGEAPVAKARGRNLEQYLQLMGWTPADEGDERTGIVRQLEEFSASLVSWNLEEEDGTPIPCTPRALFAVDNDLALALATQWLDVIGGKVDGPLPQSSPAGEPSPVVSIPMEPLSAPQTPTSVPA